MKGAQPPVDAPSQTATGSPELAEPDSAREAGLSDRSERSATTPHSSSPTGTSVIASPFDALHHDELARSRRLALIGISLAGVVAAAAALLGYHPGAAPLLYVAVVAAAAGNGYLFYLARSPARYTPGHVAAVWELTTLGVSAGIIYVGVFSPAPLALLISVYFISLGNSLRIALAVYLTFAVIMAGASAAFISGLARDPGLITAGGLETGAQVLVQVLVQAIFAATFLLARWSRRSMVDSVTELDRAVRQISKREALFEEARQDLERALRPGGEGRFTGQKVGPYVLGDLIGRGGIGEVYEAIHEDGKEPAAVKMLQASVLGDSASVKRFLREAKFAASLDVPNVVRVLEVSDETDPIPYLAMERLHGQDLSHMLRTTRQLDAAQTIELVRQVGAGLSAAADAGIVHRDIKPQNLFWTQSGGGGRGTWKILDFGISKLAGEGDTLTQGRIVGTPVYMAPEQAEGDAVDHRTDLYALAAIAYRALTGLPPFRGKDMPSILYAVVHTMPGRPSELADLPEEVDAALAIGLAKRPQDRFASADELATALAGAFERKLSNFTIEHARGLQDRHPWGEKARPRPARSAAPDRS
jgi:eukaryotic-like serine/threonine-protein kinase